MMRRLLAAVCFTLGVAGAWRTAGAQTVAAAPSAAQQCLTRAPGQEAPLAYPEELLARKDTGRFKVSLTFHGPDAAPWFRVLDDTPIDKSFIRVVREYVAGYRVPCMAAGDPPVVFTQEYVFAPNDGRKVMATQPTDERERLRQTLAKCVRSEAAAPPEYPEGARQLEMQGKVYVELAFDGPTSPPVVRVHDSPHSRLLATAMKHAQSMRMPCHPGDGRVAIDMLYKFSLIGDRRTLLKDANVASVVRSAAAFPRPAYFDWNTMGCPFDLRLTYFQPFRPNQVQQLETDRPERQAFMDWLSAVRLKLDDKTNNAVLGDTMTVHVPCGTLDQ
jgi:hypothetical protein